MLNTANAAIAILALGLATAAATPLSVRHYRQGYDGYQPHYYVYEYGYWPYYGYRHGPRYGYHPEYFGHRPYYRYRPFYYRYGYFRPYHPYGYREHRQY